MLPKLSRRTPTEVLVFSIYYTPSSLCVLRFIYLILSIHGEGELIENVLPKLYFPITIMKVSNQTKLIDDDENC